MGAPQGTLVPLSSWLPTATHLVLPHQAGDSLTLLLIFSHVSLWEGRKVSVGGRSVSRQTSPLVRDTNPPRGPRKFQLIEHLLRAGLWVCYVDT